MEIQVLIVRFPLGSGINGNLPVALTNKATLFDTSYASLWEVELMETLGADTTRW